MAVWGTILDHFQKPQIGLKGKNEQAQELSYSMKGSTTSSGRVAKLAMLLMLYRVSPKKCPTLGNPKS